MSKAITDQVVTRALETYQTLVTAPGEDVPHTAMRHALERVLGNIEQATENDLVREARERGRCPTCGADYD